MNKQESNILNMLLIKPFINQRILAEVSGHSLGVVNRSLKELIKAEYLDDSIRPALQQNHELQQFSKLKHISTGAEPAVTVRRRNILNGVLDRVWKSIECPCFEFAQKCLYLRPELFNGIQVKTVRWKINASNTGAVQQVFHCLCMVRFHIIHYEDRIAPFR